MRDDGDTLAEISFVGEAIVWHGPAPHVFVRIPDEHVATLRDAARRASYGWGCIPVEAIVREVAFTTSLFPKDGGYLLPLKAAVRRSADIAPDDVVAVTLTVRAPASQA